jgi:NAD(P)-dependent dehydrogenase (short-subunit alcohol dehydrogenase family)
MDGGRRDALRRRRPLDLTDPASVSDAASDISDAVGAPYALVHNAGITAAGMVEETPVAMWQSMFATNLFGPVALTRALLPSMRAAGTGRIVLVSSESGVRGMPATAPYSSVKAALERWGESMACEVGPFGIGVSVLVTGTYATDSITDAGTTDCRVLDGPYARHHRTMDKRGRAARRYAARSPDLFAAGLAKALGSAEPFDRSAVGPTRECSWWPVVSAAVGAASHDPRDDGYPAVRRDAVRNCGR